MLNIIRFRIQKIKSNNCPEPTFNGTLHTLKLLLVFLLFSMGNNPYELSGCDPALLYFITGTNPEHEFSKIIIKLDMQLRSLIPLLNEKGIETIPKKSITGVFSTWLEVIEKFSTNPPSFFNNADKFRTSVGKINKKMKLLLQSYRDKDRKNFHDAIRDIEDTLLELFKRKDRFSLTWTLELRELLKGEKKREKFLAVTGRLLNELNISLKISLIKPADERKTVKFEKIRFEKKQIIELLKRIQIIIKENEREEELTEKVLQILNSIEKHEKKIIYYLEWEE
ncbi:hypothetical protein ACFL35_06275 [Candidatus Riflebacteria bacterium]